MNALTKKRDNNPQATRKREDSGQTGFQLTASDTTMVSSFEPSTVYDTVAMISVLGVGDEPKWLVLLRNPLSGSFNQTDAKAHDTWRQRYGRQDVSVSQNTLDAVVGGFSDGTCAMKSHRDTKILVGLGAAETKILYHGKYKLLPVVSRRESNTSRSTFSRIAVITQRTN